MLTLSPVRARSHSPRIMILPYRRPAQIRIVIPLHARNTQIYVLRFGSLPLERLSGEPCASERVDLTMELVSHLSLYTSNASEYTLC